MARSNTTEFNSTIIAADASFEGELRFSGTLRIEGRYKGTVSSETGTLIIGEKAVVEAEANVGMAIIYGSIQGSVDAEYRIEAYTPAKIEGDIRAPVISIDAGVVFNGNCEMTARTIASEKKKFWKKTAGSSNIESLSKTG